MLPANEIAKLLSSDDINVPDEEAIFQALMMWVRHDLQNRQRDLGMLLSYIRLPLLPAQVQVRRADGEPNYPLKCHLKHRLDREKNSVERFRLGFLGYIYIFCFFFLSVVDVFIICKHRRKNIPQCQCNY